MDHFYVNQKTQNMQIEISISEYSNHMLVHEKIQINTDEYPELEGMGEEEAMKYINENAHNMKATGSEEPASFWSLHDELLERDIIRDKEYSYSTEISKD